jgi:hypothetical protein
MSIEQVLLFLLVIAVPLLERLVRAMRTRSGGAPPERTPGPARGPVSRPRGPVAVADAGAGAARMADEVTAPPIPVPSLPPAPPETVRRARSGQRQASERALRLAPERRPGPAPSIRGRQADRARARVLAGGDLRRAMVLIAVLGPCRALERQDASQPG